jgi:hypothetical protein
LDIGRSILEKNSSSESRIRVWKIGSTNEMSYLESVGSEVVADESDMMIWVFRAGLITGSFSEVLSSDAPGIGSFDLGS